MKTLFVLFSLLTSQLMTMNAFASSNPIPVTYLDDSAFSQDARNLFESSLNGRCNNMSYYGAELTEVESHDYGSTVAAAFEIRYTFDGVHPITETMTVTVTMGYDSVGRYRAVDVDFSAPFPLCH